ncbi:MAG TPA: ComF family protein [Anaerovoracaceae bacterium]|nr:ComF family protein [Anaerovoracaceae bacterium]
MLDLIYPPNIYCIYCGKPIDKRFPYSLCPTCANTIRWANKTNCIKCGTPMWEMKHTISSLCSNCRIRRKSFDGGFTCTGYGFLEKELIHFFKYGDRSYLAWSLGDLMYERIENEINRPDMIVPVPMYKRKERRRGYNQAGLLAKAISKRMHIPYYSHLLIRTKDTTPMNKLNAKEREENVQSVFKAADWVQNTIYGTTILLIDDVLTTGNTADACSKVLKSKGAHKVYVLTFAAGMDINRDYIETIG